MPDIHGSVGPATLDESGMQYPKRTASCERSRLFTCVPYRPGKSLRVDPSASPSASLRASAHRDDTTECQHHKPLLSWQWEGSNHVPAPNQNAKGPGPHLLLRKIMPLSTTVGGRVGPSAPERRRGPASFQPVSLSGAVAPVAFPVL